MKEVTKSSEVGNLEDWKVFGRVISKDYKMANCIMIVMLLK